MKFSFIGRLENKLLGSKLNVPGPGTYPQLGIKPDGKYMFSKYKNTMGIIWSSSKEKRFRYKDFNKYFLVILEISLDQEIMRLNL